MTHTAAPIAKRLTDLHEHISAHETAAEQATRQAKDELLAKIAEHEQTAAHESVGEQSQ